MPGAMVPNAMNRCHKLTGGAIKGTSREQGTGSGSDDSGTWKRLNKVEVKVEPEAMRKKKPKKPKTESCGDGHHGRGRG